jgi:hypothetical protein
MITFIGLLIFCNIDMGVDEIKSDILDDDD